MTFWAKAWLSSPKHPNYVCVAKAVETVYGIAPDFTREGGSIPITSALEDSTGMNVLLLLLIGACDDMARSQNEKYNISNFMNGIKVLGLSLHEICVIEVPKPSKRRCLPVTEEELMVRGAFMKRVSVASGKCGRRPYNSCRLNCCKTRDRQTRAETDGTEKSFMKKNERSEVEVGERNDRRKQEEQEWTMVVEILANPKNCIQHAYYGPMLHLVAA